MSQVANFDEALVCVLLRRLRPGSRLVVAFDEPVVLDAQALRYRLARGAQIPADDVVVHAGRGLAFVEVALRREGSLPDD
ncbi:MAG: hypothetical protein ACYSUM_15885 [Planctomycetota bacterium]|jgi:hypothetical protein